MLYVCFIARYSEETWSCGFFGSLSGILAFGVKESAIVNKIFTALNILVLIFVIIAGFIKGDIGNWQITEEEIWNYTITAYVVLQI